MTKYTYDAFGNQSYTVAYSNNPFGYCGEYYDPYMGGIYLRARIYNPGMGRFTTEDPARDGLNWYAYCGNNPVMFIDPTGFYKYYIFYNADVDEYNESLGDRAKEQQKNLINKGIKENDIYIKGIGSEAELKDEWNKIEDKTIENISLYFHSNPLTLIINASRNQYVRVKQVKKNGIYTNNLLFSDLPKKNINKIDLYACNSAHLDYKYSNIAHALITTQNTNYVTGWDGSMRWSFFGGEPILADSQEYFKDWVIAEENEEKRLPIGRINYIKIADTVLVIPF